MNVNMTKTPDHTPVMPVNQDTWNMSEDAIVSVLNTAQIELGYLTVHD